MEILKRRFEGQSEVGWSEQRLRNVSGQAECLERIQGRQEGCELLHLLAVHLEIVFVVETADFNAGEERKDRSVSLVLTVHDLHLSHLRHFDGFDVAVGFNVDATHVKLLQVCGQLDESVAQVAGGHEAIMEADRCQRQRVACYELLQARLESGHFQEMNSSVLPLALEQRTHVQLFVLLPLHFEVVHQLHRTRNDVAELARHGRQCGNYTPGKEQQNFLQNFVRQLLDRGHGCRWKRWKFKWEILLAKQRFLVRDWPEVIRLAIKQIFQLLEDERDDSDVGFDFEL